VNRQANFGVQFERGEAGLRALAPGAAVIIIVDVLSFSTAVDVAVNRGACVLPYRYADTTARDFARREGALLAVPRDRRTAEEPFTLSPATLANLPEGARLVLPSPNGSTLLAIAAEIAGARVVVGCLRNAAAVAAFAASHSPERAIAVIAAGERWPDGSLRPALEDDLGAGAIIAALDARNASPEAVFVAEGFARLRRHVAEQLRTCTTGSELSEAGYQADLEIAGEMNVSMAVPALDAFREPRALTRFE
jgi:2-phosphosulfolactate phosphatase